MTDFLRTAFPLLFPVIALIAVETLFLRTLRKRSGVVEPFEIGVFFSVIVMVYALVPFGTLAANGFTYSPLGDSRFFLAQPSPGELASIYWLYFLFLASFTIAYCANRGKAQLHSFFVQPSERGTFLILVLFYLLVRAFFVFIWLHYNIANVENYGETYLAIRGLPLLVQQFANHLGGISLTLQMLLMAYMVLNYKKYRFFIWCWVAIEILTISILGIGARTGLFVLLLTFLITWHLNIKPLKTRTIALVCASAMVLFIGLGLLRALSTARESDQVDVLESSNEFEAILANAYDLGNLKASGDTREIFPRFYLADFLNLVPQQLSPFRKLDVADWYVGTYYPTYAEQGGGLAFGVVAESVTGFGWFDLLWRGALLGWIFAWAHRRLLSGPSSFWKYGLYLWLTLLSYQCFRMSTFALVPRLFYQFFLVFLIVKVVSQLSSVRGPVQPGAASFGTPNANATS